MRVPVITSTAGILSAVDFRAVFESVPSPLLLLQPDGHYAISAVNGAFLSITARAREELVGRPLLDIFSSSSHRDAVATVQDLLASLNAVVSTRSAHAMAVQKFPVCCGAAREQRAVDRYWRCVNSPVLDRHGAVQYIALQIEDVTRPSILQGDAIHGRHASLANTAHERLTLALKSAKAGAFDWDLKKNTNYWSEEMFQVYGVRPEEFGGKLEDWFSCVLEEDREAVIEADRLAVETGELAREFRIRRRDTGEVRWIQTSGSVITDNFGKVVRIVGISVDITGRKHAEEALLRSHNDLETRVQERTAELEEKSAEIEQKAMLLDMANDAILVRTPDEKIVYWNRGAERLYGWTKEEALGKSPHELFGNGVPSVYREIADRDYWAGELLQSRRDGTQITVASRWTALRDKDGRFNGWLELNSDISRQKAIEASLRELSGRLLQLQDEERRRIARDLHDSTGQTLVLLNMNLHRLNGMPGMSRAAMQLAEESTALVQAITMELRTLSHLLHPPLLDEMGLRSALRWFVEGFTKRSGIETSLLLDDEFGRLSDELEITIFRIVQEGLTNIHRHSGSATAELRITRSSGELRVEIQDYGRGIPSETRMSTTGGVGLRGMRERVSQLGGHLEIECPAKGTLLVARFPLSKDAMALEATAGT